MLSLQTIQHKPNFSFVLCEVEARVKNHVLQYIDYYNMIVLTIEA